MKEGKSARLKIEFLAKVSVPKAVHFISRFLYVGVNLEQGARGRMLYFSLLYTCKKLQFESLYIVLLRQESRKQSTKVRGNDMSIEYLPELKSLANFFPCIL